MAAEAESVPRRLESGDAARYTVLMRYDLRGGILGPNSTWIDQQGASTLVMAVDDLLGDEDGQMMLELAYERLPVGELVAIVSPGFKTEVWGLGSDLASIAKMGVLVKPAGAWVLTSPGTSTPSHLLTWCRGSHFTTVAGPLELFWKVSPAW